MLEPSNRTWAAGGKNVAITGASGAGKTWISNALGVAAIDRIAYKSYTMHIEGDESMRKRMGGIG